MPGLKITGAKGQYQCTNQESPVRGEPRHNQIAQDLDDGRRKNSLFIADTIGDTARQYGHKRLHQRPEREDGSDLGSGKPESTVRGSVGCIQARDLANAVIGQPLDHLHAAANPEHVGQATQSSPDSQLLDVLDGACLAFSFRICHCSSLCFL